MNDRISFQIFLWAVLVTAALFVFVPASTAGAQSRYSLGLGFDFASGDYGTGITSDSSVASLDVGYYPTERLDLLLTIPWLYQSSGATTTSGGIRFGVRGRQNGSDDPDSIPRGPVGAASLSDPEGSRRGLGDVTLSAGYILLQETERAPLVRPNAFIKFPTAETGLGTGEYDLGAGVDLSKWMDGWYVFGRGAVIFQGGKNDLGLKDFATYEGGFGYQTGENLLPILSLWGATSPAESSSSLLEARLSLNYRLSVSSGFAATARKGLSGSSPDYGFGGAVFFNF